MSDYPTLADPDDRYGVATRRDMYGLGYRHGRRLAEHQPNENHERALRLGVKLAGNTKHRAWALGELRGYRQAAGLPEPLYGHRLETT
jgi:hypothetical protein